MAVERNPLIIPGPDGEEYRDAYATAQYLGVSLSTLRAHQYHDGPEGAWPRPVDPDDVVLELAGLESGFTWARAIDELLNRSGGNGMACRLWRTSELRAFKARRAAGALDTQIPDGDVDVSLGFGGRRIGSARVVEDESGITAMMTIADSAVAEALSPGLDARSCAVATPVEDLANEPFTDAVSVALRGGKESARQDAVEQWAAEHPDGTVTEISRAEPPKKLTAREVLDAARRRREGK